MQHRTRLLVIAALAIGLATTAAPAAAAGRGTVERWSVVDTFDDDLYLDLCGITTRTTVTERGSLTTYPDGSQKLHVTRTFVSEDPRLPIEKGAGTAFFAPDGTKTVNGLPLLLLKPGAGVIVVAAGRAIFGTDVTIHGPDPDLSDLGQYYCP